jgi:hypothetical protein
MIAMMILETSQEKYCESWKPCRLPLQVGQVASAGPSLFVDYCKWWHKIEFTLEADLRDLLETCEKARSSFCKLRSRVFPGRWADGQMGCCCVLCVVQIAVLGTVRKSSAHDVRSVESARSFFNNNACLMHCNKKVWRKERESVFLGGLSKD